MLAEVWAGHLEAAGVAPSPSILLGSVVMVTLWMILIIYSDYTGMTGPVYKELNECVQEKKNYIINNKDHIFCVPVNLGSSKTN